MWVTIILKELGLTPLFVRHQFHIFKAFRAILFGPCPSFLSSLAPKFFKNLSDYSSRFHTNVQLPSCRTHSLHNSFFHKGSKLWNSLPTYLHNLSSRQFCSKVSDLFLTKKNTATCIADRSLPPCCWWWWVALLVSAHTICFCHINMLLFKCCQSFIAKYTPIISVPGRFLTSGERDHLQDRDFSLEQQFAPEVVVNTIIVKDFHNFSRRPSFPKLTKNKSGHHWRNFKISLNFAGVIFIESLLENEIFRMVAGEWGQEENRTSYRPIQVQLSCSISFNVLANHFARKANEGMLRYLAHSLFVSVFSYCQG